jgi:hypothetical protein
MGCVYLGVDEERAARVAIKVLSKQTDESMQRFRAEARAVSLISHFNIVNLVDVAELPDGRPYMVMELVEGQSLRDAAPGASIETIVRVCSEVLSALEAAHAIGIVHRDLKPDNIMVTRAGHAKVLDFGVAKLAPGVGGGHTPRTAEGLTMGTPAYMAPEQVIGGTVDARTDVYTMGVVLFEALTGRRPFSAGSDVEVMRAHRDKQPPRPRTLAPKIPTAVEDVILRALAKDPAKRFQSARAMASALLDAVEGRASAKQLARADEVPTPRERPAAPAPPSRIPAMIAVAAIAIAATVVFTIARARKKSQELPPDAAIVVAIDASLEIDASEAPVVDATVVMPAPPIDAALPDRVDVRPVKATLPDPITRAADFSTEAFDPLAYLARAAELAKQLAADARLVEIQARPVSTAHSVDLSRTQAHVEYRYLSESGAKAAPFGGARPCLVVVNISRSGARARVETDKRCAMKPISAPRCSLKRLREVMTSAYSNDSGGELDISFTFRGSWSVIAIPSERPRDRSPRMEIPDC